MIDRLLAYIAPHHCYGCDTLGDPLCNNCQFNIISESPTTCIICKKPSMRGVCSSCSKAPFSQAWVVGERSGELEKLIDDFKFHRVKRALLVAAQLLDHTLPHFNSPVHIVPIPTIPKHIRLRGYDHMLMIATYLTKNKHISVCRMLERKDFSVQVGASKATRKLQAKSAFVARIQCDQTIPHLIIDDIVTTGATLTYAAKTLRQKGIQAIWVAALARSVDTPSSGNSTISHNNIK